MTKRLLFIDHKEDCLPDWVTENRLKRDFGIETVRVNAADPITDAFKRLEADPCILGVVSDSILIQKREAGEEKSVSEHMMRIHSLSPFIRVALQCTELTPDKERLARSLGISACYQKNDEEGINQFYKDVADACDVVVSYSGSIVKEARTITEALCNERVATFPDADCMQSASSSGGTFEQKVKAAKAAVLIISAEPDEQLRREWNAVLRNIWSNKTFRIFPVIFDNAPIPGFLLSWAVHRTSRSREALASTAAVIGKALRGQDRTMGIRINIPRRRLQEVEGRLQQWIEVLSTEPQEA